MGKKVIKKSEKASAEGRFATNFALHILLTLHLIPMIY